MGTSLDREQYKVAIPQLSNDINEFKENNVKINRIVVDLTNGKAHDIGQYAAYFQNLTTGYFTAIAGDIEYLSSRNAYVTHLKTDVLDGGYARIDAANITELGTESAWINNLLVHTDLLSQSGTIYKLNTIELDANRITAGTMDVERLVITDGGHKYLLRIDPITQVQSYEKLDGDIVGEHTLHADKLITHTITTDHITVGDLAGTNGKINLHDGTFYYATNGTWASATKGIMWDGSDLKIKGNVTITGGNVYTKTETDGQINGIQIGARNLLLDSDSMASWYKGNKCTIANGVATLTGTSANWDSVVGTSKYDAALYNGDTYSVSFEYKSSVGCSVTFVIAGSAQAVTSSSWGRSKYCNWTSAFTLPSSGGVWKKYTLPARTISVSDLTTGSGDVVSGYLQCYNRTDDASLQLRHFKFEKGNKATDWSPAPEDAENALREQSTNMLLDVDVPSVGKIKADYDRYFSDSGNSSYITCSIVSISDPPEPNIKYAYRAVGNGTNTSNVARGLAFYSASNTTAIPFKVGTEYTVSFWGRCTSGSAKTYVNYRYKTTTSRNALGTGIDLTSSWKLYKGTIRLESMPTDYNRVWFYIQFNAGVTGTAELCGFKITAGASASTYITKIDDAGIFISPINQLPTTSSAGNSVRIDGNGMTVYKSGVSSLAVGETNSDGNESVRVGKEGQTRTEIDYHSLQLKDKEGSTYFYVSDLRDTNGDATVTSTRIGDGTTKTFSTDFDIKSLTSVTRVTIDGTVTTAYTVERNSINAIVVTFTNAPSNGSVIRITYVSQDTHLKAYTFGMRDASGDVGGMSVAEGVGATSSGDCSHAEGRFNVSSASASHAEGEQTVASAYCAHAEGSHTLATEQNAHAEGRYTEANGLHSHAEGHYTVAHGRASHAGGYYTEAQGFAQTVIGKYNKPNGLNNYAFIIGNGTADNARSDAMVVTFDGMIQAENTLCYGECSTGASTVAKTVTVANPSFTLQTGATIAVKFTNNNTATDPTLNVNGTGAKAIKKYGTTSAGTSSIGSWYSNSVILFVYDGTYWRMCDTNLYKYAEQANTTTDADYRVLFSGNANDTSQDTLSRKNANLLFNPSQGSLKVKGFDSIGRNFKSINCDVSKAEVQAQDNTLTSSSADTDWFKALLMAICVKYPTETNTLFRGYLAPSSARYYEVFIYDTSVVDSTTKLPRYSFGMSLAYSGGFTKFGTDNYVWRLSNVDTNTTYSGMTDAEYQAGTSTTNRLITPARLKAAIAYWVSKKATLFSARQTSANLTADGQTGISHFLATSTMTTSKPSDGDGHIIHLSWDTNAGWDNQLYIKNGNNPTMLVRGQNSGTWGAWKKVYTEASKPTASDVGAVPTSRTVNGHALTGNVEVTASDVGAVPTSRTVNGHALTENINVTAADVGAKSTAQLDCGMVSISPKAGEVTSKAVSFNHSFTSAPRVVCSAQSSVPNVIGEVTVSNVTTTGFTAYLLRGNTTSTNIFWIAMI